MALAAGSLEEWSSEAAPVITSLLDVGGMGDRLAGPRASSVRSVGGSHNDQARNGTQHLGLCRCIATDTISQG